MGVGGSMEERGPRTGVPAGEVMERWASGE